MKESSFSKDQYLSIPEIATILGMSRIAVYKKVKKGDIKAIKIGKTYGIPKSYLSEVSGKAPSSARRKKINRAVKKVVREYGELLRKLGNE